MIRAALAALLLALALPAAALCDRVQVRGLSYHFDRSKSYQEINPGLGCEWRWRNDDVFASLGAYSNSFGETVVDGIVGWTPFDLGRLCPWNSDLCRSNVRLGAVAGVFYGYDDPIVMPPVPAARIEGRRYGVYTVVIPDVVMMFFATVKF